MAKDTAMNIRVSSEDLELIKRSALEQGYDKYSEWCLKVLLDATGKKTDIEIQLEELKNRVARLESRA